MRADALALAGADGARDRRGHDADSGDSSLGGDTGDGAAAAQQLSTDVAAAASSDSSTAPTFHLSASVDSSEFPRGLAERVSYMVDGNLSSAKLSVNPPQLGPIELQIAVQGTHAQVSMSAHSAVTRDALQSSIPQLKDMLNAQGFGQVNVDISQRSFQDRAAFSKAYVSAPASGGDSSSTAAAAVAAAPRAARSALDAYA